MNYLYSLNPLLQTIIATLFTFTITSLGSALVFFFKKINQNILKSMLALSAGIMLSASFFSLINPAIEQSTKLNLNIPLTLSIGLFLGTTLLYLADKIFNKKIKHKSIKRNIMLILSITIHNIPEGMAIGVAFASTLTSITTTASAFALAIGIGIQNFPEGSAISLPLRQDGLSRFKAFLFGSLSGLIEIISGIIGYLLVLKITLLLPYLLSFAAGAMIYVVIQELIPDSQTNEKKEFMTLLTMFGFIIMMILDLALG